MELGNGRRSANYHPNIWDGNLIHSLRSEYNDLQAHRHEQLKQAVGQMLDVTSEPLDNLTLIDHIQRLGVAYHFDKQINDALNGIHVNIECVSSMDDLHTTSLSFRLLRQHGYNISSEIFMKFKDGKGGFKASLCEDVDGLLSLYEASFHGTEGETILDEAKAFSTTNLRTLMGHTEVGHAQRIAHALDLPLHWRMTRLEARHYIDAYEENKNQRNDDLLEFAKLDFNMLQALHQKELKDLFAWWDSTELERKLGFVRNRPMESYLFSVGMTFEPQFSECRKAITKDIMLIAIIDDIFDVYGSLDELELFTNAVNRWDSGAIDQLPEYMKLCYVALFNTTNEIAFTAFKETGWNILDYLKKLWATQCNSYLVEAQWFHKGYIPTLDEYLNNARVSVGVPLVLAHTFCFMQQGMKKEDIDHIDKHLKLILSSSLIFRLYDDLGTSEAEQQRGDVSKSIQCYMRETGASVQVAREYIKNLTSEAWKKLNEESLKASPLYKTFVNAAINSVRAGVCTYRHGDGFGVASHETKDKANALFLEPVPMKDCI